MTSQLAQALTPDEVQDEISSLQRRWHAMQPAIGILPMRILFLETSDAMLIMRPC